MKEEEQRDLLAIMTACLKVKGYSDTWVSGMHFSGS